MHADASQAGRTSPPWPLIALGVALLFAFEFAGIAAEWRNSGLPWPLRYPLVWQFTGHLAFFAMLPPLLRLFASRPLRASNAREVVPVYLVAMLLMGFAQMLLIWGLRVIAYATLGWGAYHPGQPRYFVPMELLRAVPGYLGALGLHSLGASLRAQRAREQAALRLDRELAEARLALLKSQLNPHFLFNALNALRGAIAEDPAGADRMVEHLAAFLRLALRHASAQQVTLRTELDFIEAWLAVMRARFEERLDVRLEVDDSLRDALVPHMILQPLVENATQHALDEPGATARVDVIASRTTDRLVLRVRDNGPGASPSRGSGLGVGLANSRARLRASYGDAHVLDAGPAPGGGFEVRVELPWRVGEPA